MECNNWWRIRSFLASFCCHSSEISHRALLRVHRNRFLAYHVQSRETNRRKVERAKRALCTRESYRVACMPGEKGETAREDTGCGGDGKAMGDRVNDVSRRESGRVR